MGLSADMMQSSEGYFDCLHFVWQLITDNIVVGSVFRHIEERSGRWTYVSLHASSANNKLERAGEYNDPHHDSTRFQVSKRARWIWTEHEGSLCKAPGPLCCISLGLWARKHHILCPVGVNVQYNTAENRYIYPLGDRRLFGHIHQS